MGFETWHIFIDTVLECKQPVDIIIGLTCLVHKFRFVAVFPDFNEYNGWMKSKEDAEWQSNTLDNWPCVESEKPFL